MQSAWIYTRQKRLHLRLLFLFLGTVMATAKRRVSTQFLWKLTEKVSSDKPAAVSIDIRLVPSRSLNTTGDFDHLCQLTHNQDYLRLLRGVFQSHLIPPPPVPYISYTRKINKIHLGVVSYNPRCCYGLSHSDCIY